MTRPVVESTEAGILSNYGWRIRQLERRPDQRGRLPFAMMEWNPQIGAFFFPATSGLGYGFDELTVGGGGPLDFTWGIQGREAVGGIFTPELTTGVIRWGNFETAFVSGQVITIWENTFAGAAMASITLASPATASGFTATMPHWQDGSFDPRNTASLDMYVDSESQFASGGFQQNSGVDQNLIYASVSIFLVDTGVGAVGI